MTKPVTMLAAVAETSEGPVAVREVVRPRPQAGQALVRIHASGTNPLDTKIRAGQAAHARHPLPAVLGMDLAGVVEAVGTDAGGFKVGDEVYGFTGGVAGIQGSAAEFAAVDSRLLAHKPSKLTMREAAVLPLVAITAWEGLIDRARLQAGQTVLVQGGAGGVGHAAVQIALAHGAKVFATGRSADLDYIASLGATAIDGSEDVDSYVAGHTGGAGFDIVYDTGGGALLDASFQAVRRCGHVVSCLGWGTHLLAPLSFRQASYSGVFTLQPLIAGEGRDHFGRILTEVARMVERGELLPRLDPRAFTLADVAEAHDTVLGINGARRANGKIAISIV